MESTNTSTQVIAEIGQAHDGSLGILHSYIDAVAATGVKFIKFQTHIAAAESSDKETFRIPFSYQDSTRYQYWDRMSFSQEEWLGIKSHCDESGIEFLSTPFSIAAVKLLEKVGVKRFKIGSGDLSNLPLLEMVARSGKPVLISSGMGTMNEIEQAVSFLRQRKVEVTVFQCTTRYPTPPEMVGLNVIDEIRQKFDCKVGLSDHSGTIFPGLAAAALGVDFVEVHTVFDKRMFGPDTSSSLTIEDLMTLSDGCRFINTINAHPLDKSNADLFAKERKVFSRSLAINKNLEKGHALAFEDLETKKPAGHGIDPKEYQSIVGKVLAHQKNENEFLNFEDFE